MDRIVSLLKEKNEYLEKFFTVNEHELISFTSGDFENVEPFYQARDKILDLVQYVDKQLEGENVRVNIRVTDSQRAEVQKLLLRKDELVGAILEQDLRIIEYIEAEKTEIIRELKMNRQARRAVGAYANVEKLHELEEKF